MLIKNLYLKLCRLILSLCLCIYLSACQSRFQETRNIADPSSPLLNILIQGRDLSGEWHWISNGVIQQSEVPTPENSLLVESALRGLAGAYGTKAHYVSIDHVLKRYRQQPPFPTSLNLEKDWEMPQAQAFSPKVVSVGQSMVSECVRQLEDQRYAIVACVVMARYTHIVSTVTIRAPAEIDNQTVEQILSQILVKVDKSIRELNE